VLAPGALQVQLTNAQVSMRRLTGYFMLEEREEYVEFVKEPGEDRPGCRLSDSLA